MPMQPFLIEVEPPPFDEEHDDDETWDSTFQIESDQYELGWSTICSHAVGFGQYVYRIQDGTNHYAWRVSIHRTGIVSLLSSNTDGSVIVAVTSSGQVALLRGLDGKELARRSETVQQLQWVGSNTLWMLTDTKIILVTNIQGEALNHAHDGAVVSSAVRDMQISAIPLHRKLYALAMLPSLRVVACNEEGNLQVFDCINNNTRLQPLEGVTTTLSEVQHSAGLKIQHGNAVVGSLISDGTSKLFWFDAEQTDVSCDFEFEEGTVTKLETVQALDTTCGIAVLLKASEKTMLQILQLLVSQDGTTVSQPHILYTVHEMQHSIHADLGAVANAPFAVRFKVWSNTSNSVSYKCFTPDRDNAVAIGSVRRAIFEGDFGAANTVTNNKRGLLDDEFSDFHPSEVPWGRLQLAVKEQRSDIVRKALNELKSTVSSEKGLSLFVRAIDLLRTAAITTLSEEQFQSGLEFLCFVLNQVIGNPSLTPNGKKVLSDILAEVNTQSKAIGFYISNKIRVVFPLHKIRSPRHLYTILIKESQFNMARMLCLKTETTGEIDTNSIVFAFSRLSSEVQPGKYFSLLRDVIFPRLIDGDDNTYRIKGWACQTADSLDADQDDLESAIRLLELVDEQVKVLEARVHLSFGGSSPFIEKPHEENSRPRTSSSVSISSKRRTAPIHNNPMPTILEPSKFSGGALRSTNMFSAHWDSANVLSDSVKNKLEEAKFLLRARELGVSRSIFTLSDLSNEGSKDTVIKELVHLFSAASEPQIDRCIAFDTLLRPLCEQCSVSLDDCILQYASELCDGKNVTDERIVECCSVARFCSSKTKSCDIALIVLGAARLCGHAHSAVQALSKDAIVWAAYDSALKSELEEASRLLLVDAIVVKYCGLGARELFHVQQPRHTMKLLDYIAEHVGSNYNIVEDSIQLCDAFQHLSRTNAVRYIMGKAIRHDKDDLWLKLFDQILAQSAVLVMEAVVGVVALAHDVLLHCSECKSSSSIRVERERDTAKRVCRRICLLLSHAIRLNLSFSLAATHEISHLFAPVTLANVQDVFFRLKRLQDDHNVFVAVTELANLPSVLMIARSLLKGVVSIGEDGEPVQSRSAHRKVAVSLLADGLIEEHDLWTVCVIEQVKEVILEHGKSAKSHCLKLLSDLDLLQPGSHRSAQVLLQLVLSLYDACKEEAYNGQAAKGPLHMVLGLAILQDWALRICSKEVLPLFCTVASCLDTAFRTLVRCDEPLGKTMDYERQNLISVAALYCSGEDLESKKEMLIPVRVNKPILHESWQMTQDGLLLPARPALINAMDFCAKLLNQEKSDPTLDLYRLVSSQGAHHLGMEVLLATAFISGFRHQLPQELVSEIQDGLKTTAVALAERSLGGTGSGITSATVDSQCALVYLLGLPIRDSFVIFTSCIPAASQTQNYKRLLLLANIGVAMSDNRQPSSSDNRASPLLSIGWSNQEKLRRQCTVLANEAKWWWILRSSSVQFNSDGFKKTKYLVSLLPQVLEKLKAQYSMQEVQRLAKCFARTFGLNNDIFTCSFVEFLFQPQAVSTNYILARRESLVQSEKLALSMLRGIDSPLKKVAVLRKCVVTLEMSALSLRDYELHRLALSLYHDLIQGVLDSTPSMEGISSDPFEVELLLVGRRLDVLEVLLSFYDGQILEKRPPFPSFFEPLPPKFDYSVVEPPDVSYDILCGSSAESKEFDPLANIANSLQNMDRASVSTLSALGSALALPSGSIAARHLIARFMNSKRQDQKPPSFDLDVDPVLKKVPEPRNRRLLADWCASRYGESDEDRLKCLNVVVECATEESQNAEDQCMHSPCGDETLEKIEADAIELMKEKAELRGWLSELVEVRKTLRGGANAVKGLHHLVEKLIVTIDGKAKETKNLQPETLLDFLLENGSDLACTEALSVEGLSIPLFRTFCSVVHRACRYVADQHSHIDSGKRALDFANQWLFHGEPNPHGIDTSPQPQRSSADQATTKPTIGDIGSEETFVMDLAMVHSAGQWGGHHSERVASSPNQVAAIEEPSALRPCSSRELSEYAAKRTALRVAFCLAFSSSVITTGEEPSKENAGSNRSLNFDRTVQDNGKKGLKKISKHDDSETLAISQYLLGIVFAKSKALGYGTVSGIDSKSKRESHATVTFAMRHRALRAASVLSPQWMLEEVCVSEGFLDPALCSLGMCTFGLFIAKEMEEMGLSLPHPDLTQLSTMNFLSNSKEIWRRHQDDDFHFRGRLLLLLCEMSLRSNDTDFHFISSLLTEITRMGLPRSLLLALERLVESKHFRLHPPNEDTVQKQAASAVLQKIQTEMTSLESTSQSDIVTTLIRLSVIISKIYPKSERAPYISMVQKWFELDTGGPMGNDVSIQKIISTLSEED